MIDATLVTESLRTGDDMSQGEGRWTEPDLSYGFWVVRLRIPLTLEELDAGLASILRSESLDRLRDLMRKQDEWARNLSSAPDWSDRGTV